MWRASRIEAASAEGGFTLLEILVALTLLALTSTIAYSGLVAVASTKGALDREIRFWRDLGLVFERMEADFLQSVPRPLPAPEGLLPPLYGANIGENSGENSGEHNGFFIASIRQDENRIPVHVRYLCERRRLTLRTSALLSSTEGDMAWAVDTPLLHPVEQCEVAFLDGGNTWRGDWPGDQSLARPRAIRIRLALTGHGSFERIFLLP